jgi:hypothetical protein
VEKGFYPCSFGHKGVRLRQEGDAGTGFTAPNSTPDLPEASPALVQEESPLLNADRVVYCRACRRARLAIRTTRGWVLECKHDLAEADVVYPRQPGLCYSCGEETGAVVDPRESPVCPECGTEYAVSPEAVEEVRGALRPRNWPEAFCVFCRDCYFETGKGRVAVEWDPELGRYRCPGEHKPGPGTWARLSPSAMPCPRCGARVSLSQQASCPTCWARFIRDHQEDEGLLARLG